MKPIRIHTDKTIAISALFLCSAQVYDYAHKGIANRLQTETLARSLFNNEANDVLSIYGNLADLRPALEIAADLFSSTISDHRALEITRYSISLMKIDKQLQNNPEMGEQLIAGIDAIGESIVDDNILDENIITRLGELYQSTISNLSPRIMVKGENDILQKPEISAMIRVLLLCGLRSAVLWRQSGGNRFSLLLARRKLLEECHTLLQRT